MMDCIYLLYYIEHADYLMYSLDGPMTMDTSEYLRAMYVCAEKNGSTRGRSSSRDDGCNFWTCSDRREKDDGILGNETEEGLHNNHPSLMVYRTARFETACMQALESRGLFCAVRGSESPLRYVATWRLAIQSRFFR